MTRGNTDELQIITRDRKGFVLQIEQGILFCEPDDAIPRPATQPAVHIGSQASPLQFRHWRGSCGGAVFQRPVRSPQYAADYSARHEPALRRSFALLAIGLHLESLGCVRQDSLTLTLGLRADAAFLPDAVATNDALRDSLGIDTGRLPSGQVLWSPRMGVNYNLKEEGRTFLRGGLGVFSGRPPYQWLGNAYRDNGMQELFLDCRGAGAVPTFDPNTQPASCANGTGAVLRLSFFEPGVRFP